jgi:hypothetical protein
MKTGLRYGAILIGMVVVARYSTGAGRLIAQSTKTADVVIRRLQGR